MKLWKGINHYRHLKLFAIQSNNLNVAKNTQVSYLAPWYKYENQWQYWQKNHPCRNRQQEEFEPIQMTHCRESAKPQSRNLGLTFRVRNKLKIFQYISCLTKINYQHMYTVNRIRYFVALTYKVLKQISRFGLLFWW